MAGERVQVDQQADIKRKLRALLDRTVDRGCSEAEALAAAVKAGELMDQYKIDIDALDRPPIVEVRLVIPKTKADRPWGFLWAVIGQVCHVEVWTVARAAVVYYGFEPDALLAEYLHEVMERHAESARLDFRLTHEYRRRRTPKTRTLAVKAFLAGFVEALITKIRLHFRDRIHAADAVRKIEVLKAEFDKRGIEFSAPRQSKAKDHSRHEAFHVGSSAGYRVSIHDGVHGADRRDQVGETRYLR